jgi:hypothetical protein
MVQNPLWTLEKLELHQNARKRLERDKSKDPYYCRWMWYLNRNLRVWKQVVEKLELQPIRKS